MEASVTAGAAPRASEDGGPRDRVALARRIERRMMVVMLAAHAAGIVDVFLLLFYVLPAPAGVEPGEHLLPNLVGVAVYAPLAFVVASYVATRQAATRYRWLEEDREPTEEERQAVVNTPMHCLRLDGGSWLGGVVLFTAINLPASTDLAVHTGATIAVGGIVTCAVAYLLAEQIMRPLTALALAGGSPARPAWPGVEGRMVLAWLSATAAPLLGLVMVALHGLYDAEVSTEAVSRSVLVLGIATFVIGLGVTLLVARSVAQPLRAVRRALGRVQAGDFTASVDVDDASEVGLLQDGFNRMVDGLRDRERVKELYSRVVGADVARVSLDGDPTLGGKVCDVAVLFVDMVGSTQLAATAPPEQVVARLNRFFAIVVETVQDHGGWVNKFEGDAALCVFGAPTPQEDPAGCALRAARDLRARMRKQMPSADAGIGVSAGPAVAGWVGAEERFEYTVIGDPVNEAARLCELAKRRPERLLASEAIVTRAAREEAGRWHMGESTLLRGRSEPTRLAAPAG